MSLRNQTVTSVGWTSFAQIIKQGLKFLLSILLMRLLSPNAYGLLGMAMVFIGLGNIFKEFGFGSAIIQRSQLARSHYTSTFFLNIGIGALLTLVLILIAPQLSSFYNNNELISILQVLSVNFVIASVGIVPRSVLQRKMRFDLLSKIEITTAVIPGIIAVGFAFFGYGVWALVIQSLVMTLLSTVLYLIYTSWRPQWIFSWRSIKELWAYSVNLTGFQITNYWARNADDLLIGKYMGSASLGNYTRAYTLMLLPIKQVISVISSVMFSALSKMQRERERVKRAYLKSMQVLAFITFPMMIGLFVVAEPFVLVLFGEKWSGVIPLIQVLSWLGITQTLCNPTGWIYQSQGKTNWMFWWGIFGAGSLIIAILIGVWFGSVISVAISYTVANIIITYPCITIPGRLIGMSFREVFEVALSPFLISAIMGSFVYSCSYLLEEVILPIKLILLILIGITSYIAMAYIFQMRALKELKKISLIYIGAITH